MPTTTNCVKIKTYENEEKNPDRDWLVDTHSVFLLSSTGSRKNWICGSDKKEPTDTITLSFGQFHQHFMRLISCAKKVQT